MAGRQQKLLETNASVAPLVQGEPKFPVKLQKPNSGQYSDNICLICLNLCLSPFKLNTFL